MIALGNKMFLSVCEFWTLKYS